MIEYESEYIRWIVDHVGKYDKVTNTPLSYLSYLRSVSRRIKSLITPLNLSTEDDIEIISKNLNGLASVKSISNYKTAMNHYVEMVRTNDFKPTLKFKLEFRRSSPSPAY